MTYRNVLVPLDGSAFAKLALPAARALARRFDAALHTISVAGDDDAERRRAEAADALGTDVDDDRIRVVVGDDPSEAIDRHAARLEACLVCLSTHGRGRITGAVIGSVARALLQRSTGPIVAVGPSAGISPSFVSNWPAPLSTNRLVACVDGSTASEAVLPVAAEWSTNLGMSLTILTVAEDISSALGTGYEPRRRFGPDGDAGEYIAGLVEQWRDAAPEVDGSVAVDPIGPAGGIRGHLAEHHAGLVAVTTHARSGMQRLRLGSAAANIVRASVAPVVVVPTAG